jgi:chromosome condensin MukBEF complex kleisin-like MukF subunit
MRERTSQPTDGKSSRGAPIVRDQEICRMAAFRIRETANRITTLANNAADDALRRDLLNLCQRLLTEERALLRLSAPTSTH